MDNKYIKIIKGTPLFQGMSDEEIEKRVSKAEYELTFAHKFDHIVVNDSLPDAIGNVRRVIQDFIG